MALCILRRRSSHPPVVDCGVIPSFLFLSQSPSLHLPLPPFRSMQFSLSRVLISPHRLLLAVHVLRYLSFTYTPLSPFTIVFSSPLVQCLVLSSALLLLNCHLVFAALAHTRELTLFAFPPSRLHSLDTEHRPAVDNPFSFILCSLSRRALGYALRSCRCTRHCRCSPLLPIRVIWRCPSYGGPAFSLVISPFPHPPLSLNHLCVVVVVVVVVSPRIVSPVSVDFIASFRFLSFDGTFTCVVVLSSASLSPTPRISPLHSSPSLVTHPNHFPNVAYSRPCDKCSCSCRVLAWSCHSRCCVM